MKKWVIYMLVFAWTEISAQDTTRLSLLFLGDIMQHDSQIKDALDFSTGKYNYKPCFQFVKPYTQSADLAIGNLELTLAGPPYKGYPQFSAPDELLVALKDMGMDVLVTANNHCVDKGRNGVERTIQMLDSFNIQHTGTFVDEVSKLNDHPLVIHKNGFQLALLNYTFSTNGLPVPAPNIVNMMDTAEMGRDIHKAHTLKPDAIIVFVHWGIEYQSLPSKWQKDVATFCLNKGVQMVIGAHPHVIQPMEWEKGKNQLVAYSLGNFVSGQRKRYTDGGAMITVALEKVSFAPDSAVTRIDSVNHVFQWVYRTAGTEKNYYVLPVPAFERNSMGFIKDEASREAFGTFISDSRSLFKKHAENTTELKTVPPDTLTLYKVWFLTIKNPEEPWKLFPPIPYGLETESDSTGNLLCFSGNFMTKPEAEKYQARLIRDFGYESARVVEFVDGIRKE